MRKLAQWIVEKRLLFCIIFLLLAIAGAACMPFVKVNYDAAKYLPEDTETATGLEVLDREFGNNGAVSIMARGVSLQQAIEVKKQIAAVSGVKSVIWIDELMLANKPQELPESVFWQLIETMIGTPELDAMFPGMHINDQIAQFYNWDSKSALYQVTLTGSAYDQSTADALKAIEKINGGSIAYTGPAASAYSNILYTMKETTLAMLIVVPLVLIILFLMTNSFWEPVLFIAIVGISILINMGSNLIMGEVSYLTQAVAAILQLALAMDYSIFLLHRFKQEKSKGADVKEAMITALAKSFSPISASSLTTVAGFVALMFMRYTIGLDMGIVLAKGIIFSLLSVFLLMPALILYTHKLIVKTEHKSFNLPYKGYSTGLKKTRFIVPVVMVLLIIPAIFLQSHNNFQYGDFAASGGEGTKLLADKQAIEQDFGPVNNLAILLPKDQVNKELELTVKLSEIDGVQSAQSYSLIQSMGAGVQFPDSFLDQFVAKDYNRIVLNLSVEEEGEKTFQLIDKIRSATEEVMGSGTCFILGASSSAKEIKEVVEVDYDIVNLVSIALIALILFITFRSLILPILLVLVIESSIWINMAIPYLFGQPLFFIGYMIVSCVQLGATIDYGILLANRYLENRRTMDKFAAVREAIGQSGKAIITSAGILCVAGFTIGLACSLPASSVLGMAIGRGALSSLVLVLVLLPQLLMLLDKPIRYTTWRGRRNMIDNPKWERKKKKAQ